MGPFWPVRLSATLAVACSLAGQTTTYDQAMTLVKAGSFEPAIPILEKILHATPGDLRARNLMGIALSGMGRRAEANKHFEQLLAANPKFVPALKNLAHNELELGQTDKARQHFDEALRLAPADPAAHFGRAHIAFLQTEYARAIEHYEQSGRLLQQDPLAQLRYAASCLETGAREKALKTLANFPADKDAAFQLEAGVLLARLEQYKDAIRRFELALSAGADPAKTGYNLTLAHFRAGKTDSALNTANAALKNAGPSPELYSLLAQVHEKAGRTSEAYEALRASTKLNPRDESAYLELVALCLNHENQELGLEIADIGIRLVPVSSRLRLQRGVIYALQSRFEDAAADFRAAVKLNPEAPLGYIAEALVLLRTDQGSRAVEVLRGRTSERPNDHLANWLLAEALTRQGAEPATESEAVAALERSIKSNADMPQSRALLGKLMLARGDADRARVELEKALELEPESVTALYQLAQAYRKLGRTREANELFTKVGRAKQEDPSQFTRGTLLRIVRDDMKASEKR